MPTKEILLVPHLHFDPVWRRCFDRSARKHGVTVRSYAEIEERCIDAWLDMNRGTGQIREWMLDGLAKYGVTRDQVPASLTF